MRSFILCLCTFILFLNAQAQFNGDGYYRIRNVGSQRYIIVTDDKGSVNISSTSADLGAVKMLRGFENVVSDPGSVLYINEVNGLYRFESQGTDTHEIIGYDLKLNKNTDGSYKAYQEQNFLRMYLSDARLEDIPEGVLSTKDMSKYPDYLKWNITPVSSTGNEYFGITPDISYGGVYYGAFYASFPFTFASSGMVAYYVSQVENGVAVFSEVTDNMVPASMPVIIKTASAEPADNRLNIAANSATKPADNKLGGVYFHNTSKKHNNLTPYNPETMRLLGTTSKGKLGFVKASVEYLPANQAYLNVPAGTPDELELMTRAEYEAYMNTEFMVTASATQGGTVSGTGSYKRFAKAVLTAIPAEGYSFAGWSDGTDSNPYTFKVAGDLSLTAAFTPNEYKLIYLLDGVEYLSRQYAYGEPVVLESAPTKIGYTFSGWGDIPTTMPASDVTVTGTFSANSYTITYMIDGQVFLIETLLYNQSVVLPDAPVKEGLFFSGWSGAPATMPAHDVTVNAQYSIDGIENVVTECLVDVYTLQGVCVKSQVSLDELQRELPAGIYIVNGHKLVVK